jgi:hypothetical protein
MKDSNELIVRAANAKARQLEKKVADLEYELKSVQTFAVQLTERVERQERVNATKVKKLIVPKRAKAAKHVTRVIIPDSHGNHIDPVARDAFLADLKILCPEEIVGLGDHLDCGGTFNAHQVTYSNELAENYEDDVNAANAFFDACMAYAPDASWDVLEGNHELHVERWTARNVRNQREAEYLVKHFGPEKLCKYADRGFRYYKSQDFHMGLTVRGSIKIDKCFFTHGISHSKHADDAHLAAFSSNVVFGHVHRVLEVRSRTVTSQGHGAWSPGTLAKLQPLYRHTEPTTWSHGYGLQFVNKSTGRFAHWNVPIFADGTTGLEAAVGALGGR